jgi:ElaB/YqjD/DUF883 family membrane-anchored ribosome-binding protein
MSKECVRKSKPINLKEDEMADMKDRVRGGMENAADTAKGAADRVKENAQHVADKAGEYASQARDKVAEWASGAGDAAKQAGEKVQRWAGDAYDATSDAMGDFGKEISSMIRKHPLPSVLIGFGIGLLLGRAARVV